MKSNTSSQVIKAQKIRFAIRRVEAIRNRVKAVYRNQGHNIDFQDNPMSLRVYAEIWLEAAEQSNEKSADTWIEMATVLFAESILAGAINQAK